MEVEHIKKNLGKWKLKHPYCRTLITTSEASIWKTFSLLARVTSAKSKFVPNDHHDRHQQQQQQHHQQHQQQQQHHSNHGIRHLPPPDAALSCVYFTSLFLFQWGFSVKFTAILSELCCATGTDWTSACRCVLPWLQRADTEPRPRRRPHWYFSFWAWRKLGTQPP